MSGEPVSRFTLRERLRIALPILWLGRDARYEALLDCFVEAAARAADREGTR